MTPNRWNHRGHCSLQKKKKTRNHAHRRKILPMRHGFFIRHHFQSRILAHISEASTVPGKATVNTSVSRLNYTRSNSRPAVSPQTWSSEVEKNREALAICRHWTESVRLSSGSLCVDAIDRFTALSGFSSVQQETISRLPSIALKRGRRERYESDGMFGLADDLSRREYRAISTDLCSIQS